jgi:cold shock CspA family protein
MPVGVVKWFDPVRGVGLIALDGRLFPDAVAHGSAVDGAANRVLVAGRSVLFDLTWDAAGVRADNIRPHPGVPTSCRPPAEGPASLPLSRPQTGVTARWNGS